MNKLLILLLVVSYNCFAKKTCEYSVKPGSQAIKWTAFKLEKKVGVPGSFKSTSLSSIRSRSLEDLISSSSFTIDTQSVTSGNLPRDIKIAKFFFSTMSDGTLIKGVVLKVFPKKKQLEMLLILNGKRRTVNLNYVYNKGIFTAKGAINVLDFAMDDEFSALSKACSLKHEGKTWPEVMIEVSATIRKKC